jgi:uncharacterized protein (TIGR02284 family)
VGLAVRSAGERDFRDFSRLLPVKENRYQPADPAVPLQLICSIESLRGLGTKMTENGSDKNKEMERVLMEVITTLQDGQKGFADIGEHLKDDTLKRYFLAESLKRASFRADLEAELHRAGVHDVKDSGSASGALHRTWADLKAKLGGGDHTLLNSAEAGEDDAKATYKDALEQELPLPIRQLLTEQQAHILTSHDYVKRHRDELAAK